MPRLSDLRRQNSGNNKIKSLAAITTMLEVLDAYTLQKRDDGIKLIANKHLMSMEFRGKNIWDLTTPLGNWLCNLPKGVWDEQK